MRPAGGKRACRPSCHAYIDWGPTHYNLEESIARGARSPPGKGCSQGCVFVCILYSLVRGGGWPFPQFLTASFARGEQENVSLHSVQQHLENDFRRNDLFLASVLPTFTC